MVNSDGGSGSSHPPLAKIWSLFLNVIKYNYNAGLLVLHLVCRECEKGDTSRFRLRNTVSIFVERDVVTSRYFEEFRGSTVQGSSVLVAGVLVFILCVLLRRENGSAAAGNWWWHGYKQIVSPNLLQDGQRASHPLSSVLETRYCELQACSLRVSCGSLENEE